MKALSLSQPYATLISLGAKVVESRDWGTGWRGLLAIHASKRMPPEAKAFATYDLSARSVLDEHGYGITRALPLGAIVAVVRLVDVRGTGSDASRPAPWIARLSDQERAFGNYGPRRFGWFLEDVIPMAAAIPCQGSLGLWEIPADVAAQIEAQMMVGAR